MQHNLIALLVCALSLLCIQAGPIPPIMTRADEARPVSLITSYKSMTEVLASGRSGKFYHMHSIVQFGRTSRDGPLRVDVFVDRHSPDGIISAKYRAVDLTVAVRDDMIVEDTADGTVRSIISPLGTTRLRNDAILDHKTGRGLLLDVVGEDPIISMGSTERTHNDEQDLAERLVRRVLGKDYVFPKQAQKMLERGKQWNMWSRAEEPFFQMIIFIVHETDPDLFGAPGPYYRTDFEVSEFNNPRLWSSNRPGLREGAPVRMSEP